MPKKRLSALYDELAKLTQKLCRMKAAVHEDKDGFIKCVSCDEWHHWKEMQGGHWIEREKLATKFMVENIHPQCKGCNGFRMKFSTETRERYSKYMREMYGDDFCDQMLIDSKKPVKFARSDVEEWIREAKAQIKELEKKL